MIHHDTMQINIKYKHFANSSIDEILCKSWFDKANKLIKFYHPVAWPSFERTDVWPWPLPWANLKVSAPRRRTNRAGHGPMCPSRHDVDRRRSRGRLNVMIMNILGPKKHGKQLKATSLVLGVFILCWWFHGFGVISLNALLNKPECLSNNPMVSCFGMEQKIS